MIAAQQARLYFYTRTAMGDHASGSGVQTTVSSTEQRQKERKTQAGLYLQ